MGHRIHLQSRVARGSCFKLSMPHAVTPEPETRTPSIDTSSVPHRLDGVRLLVIENDLDALVAMEALLSQWGCDLRLAQSTNEAVSALENGDWRPDLVVADHHLDGDDRGTDAIGHLRKITDHKLPALLVTAAPSSDVYQRAEANKLEVMEKPLKPAQLRALLCHLAASEPQ